MNFDYDVLKKILKKNKVSTKGISNPIRIAMSLLKSKSSLQRIVEEELQNGYAGYIVGIWMPNPKNDKERKKKKSSKKKIEKILGIINQNISEISPDQESKKKLGYDNARQIFEQLEKKFKAKKAKSRSLLKRSNPFLTASIGKSYDDGLDFQIKAKFASSVEGMWGTWIEDAIAKFNPKIIRVNAAGLDLILGQTAYDIKAGPNVFNSGQVTYNKAKRATMQNLRKDEKFKGLISVKDFKVAISYGREENANGFMQNQNGLIIFGPHAWKELTGNAWNAYRLFLWQIRYKTELSRTKWSSEQLKAAVQDFIEINYGEDRQASKKAFANKEYISLKKKLKD